MIPNSRGDSNKDLQAKQEGDTINNNNNEANKFAKAPSSSRQWSAFRNPRIVRVSRTFGGKDRHSKVCTVRGLRDRRIRLSVPTAIQLYDLQDRLGLNQPSKVIDWLLDATKNDIDKLPPLQMPQGFGQFHSPLLFPFHDSTSSQSNLFSPNLFDPNNHSSFLKFGGLDEGSSDKGKWVRTMEEENYGGQVSAHKLFPLTTSHSSSSSSLPSGLLGNPNPNPMPFGSYYHLDASNLSLAQLGSHGFLSQPESSSLPNNNAAQQMLFCPQPATLPSLFPAYSPFASSAMESESRDINHFQLLSSSTSQALLQSHHLRASNYPVRPFSLSINPGLDHHMQGREEGHPHQQRDTDDS